MKKFTTFLFVLILESAMGSSVLAADQTKSAGSNSAPTSNTNDISSDARSQMAKMHQKMADCLNSDKPMQECHDSMRAEMKTMHKNGQCDHCGMMSGNKNDHDSDHCW